MIEGQVMIPEADFGDPLYALHGTVEKRRTGTPFSGFASASYFHSDNELGGGGGAFSIIGGVKVYTDKNTAYGSHMNTPWTDRLPQFFGRRA